MVGIVYLKKWGCEFMKTRKLAILAFGLGVVINIAACDSTSPEVTPNSVKRSNRLVENGQGDIGVGVDQKISVPEENNSFLIGESVTCDGLSDSKIKYTVTKAEIFESVEESDLPSDEFIRGLDETRVYFEQQNGEADFLVLTIDVEALEDMKIEVVKNRTDIHIMEFHLFNDNKLLGYDVYFQGGDESYRKDKEKTYYYFAAPTGKKVTLKAGYLVPKDWEEQNSLMLGIGGDLEKLSFVILDKEKIEKGNG